MIKYVAYCRKSTDEPERQILSIESQISELKEFALKENLQLVDFITESKTAKEPGRPKFDQVLQLIESNKANGILAWHPDRLARNSVDGGRIIYLLDTGKLLSLKFPTFWFENTPQGKFFLSIAFGQSKYYVDNLSENVKRGNRQKLRRGEWPNKAPFGYLNSEHRTIAVDEKRARFVKKAFKLYASGGYSYKDIQRFFTKHNIVNNSGRVLKTDKIKRILTSPFYYGIMKFCGELYEGKHQPIISKNLYDKVQKVVKSKARFTKPERNNFPFLGLASCGQCGAAITAEKHIKHYQRTKRTAKYIYYRCTKKKGECKQKYILDKDFEAQIRVLLKNVSLPNSVAKKFIRWAQNDAGKEKLANKAKLEEYKKGLRKNKQRLGNLLDAYFDKIVSKDEYQERKNKVIKNSYVLKQKIKDLQKYGCEWLEPFSEWVRTGEKLRKIARAKNNSSDLAIGAKTVG